MFTCPDSSSATHVFIVLSFSGVSCQSLCHPTCSPTLVPSSFTACLLMCLYLFVYFCYLLGFLLCLLVGFSSVGLPASVQLFFISLACFLCLAFGSEIRNMTFFTVCS